VRLAGIGLLTFALTACASSGVVPLDHGISMVSTRHPEVGFGPAVNAQADAYKEAATFCGKSARDVETVKLDTETAGFARPGSAALQFRCVEKSQNP
jgi:hypothetical protein